MGTRGVRKVDWLEHPVRVCMLGVVDLGGSPIRVETTEDEGFTERVHGVTLEDPATTLPVVVLSARLKGKALERILLHELIHAMSMLWDLRLNERSTRALEQALLQCLDIRKVRLRISEAPS